jgi:hypothetical protein
MMWAVPCAREEAVPLPQPASVEPLRRWDPEQIGGYTLLGRLGAGAMGQVYLGRSAAGRLVAVKTIKSELAEEPDFRTRFGQEVAAARRVSGAFTAAVVAADSEADVPWLATVYVPAPSLTRLVRTCGPIPAPAVRWLMAGCAEALEAIHGVGLVHRDLKPSNVLVSPDGPRVIDFGVARAAERIQLTVTRGSIGTPAYMAPEQARDTRQATPASDIFSLGATMVFAATGHPPYQGETVMDVLVRLATEAPDLTGLPPELAGIVGACLERDPRGRPNSASIVAKVAPDVAASGELGSAPLPPEAMALIDEYRRAPRPAAGSGPDAPGEATIGSHPAAAGLRLGAPDWTPGLPAGLAPIGLGTSGGAVPADPGPAARVSPVTAAGSLAPAVGGQSRARPPRVLLAAAGVVVAAGLVAGGWAAGSAGPSSPPQPPPGLGPVLPPPQNVEAATPGVPYIGLMQDSGDPRTVFVIHGESWPPDQPVTVQLVGVGTSKIRPVADSAGNFSYAINQDHDFFRGLMPVGTYTVRVTGPGGRSAHAEFTVQQP